MFQFRWLRMFIRKHTNPIEADSAIVWKRRLSIVYAITAWNAFGFVAYMIYSGKADWAHYHGLKSDAEMQLTPAQQWTKTIGIQDATVYRISGFKVKKYQIHNEFDDKHNLKESNINVDEAEDTK